MKRHFETYLKKCDWPEEATIDYGAFKDLLRFFIERRRRETIQVCSLLDKHQHDYIAIEERPSTIIMPPGLATTASTTMGETGRCARRNVTTTTIRSMEVREHEEFQQFLDHQVQKTILYYTDLVENIYDSLSENPNKNHAETAPAGDAIIQAALYYATTILTVRQILLRYHDFQTHYHTHDDHVTANFLLHDKTMMAAFVACGVSLSNASTDTSTTSAVQEGAQTKRPQPGVRSFRRLDDVFQWHELCQLIYVMTKQQQPPHNTESGTSSIAVQHVLEQVEHILSQSEFSTNNILTNHDAVTSSSSMLMTVVSAMKLVRHYILSSMQNAYGMNIYRRHLKGEIRAIAKIKHRIQRNDGITTADTPPLYLLHPSNRYPLLLNLLSCFLYMMNNYIIEPSSAYYANALGANDAVSGIMIGGSAWFAMFSAIFYSYWTNIAYKPPILFAGMLIMVGNVLYGMADAYKSLPICLLGRAMVGLGAPRVINRRYVADATPFHFRTLASAGFCLATAFGCALGPGVAIVLDVMPEFSVQLLGRTYVWNGMTAPGYLMAILWGVYTVTILLTFQEPLRTGLVELQQREQQQQQQSHLNESALMKDHEELEQDSTVTTHDDDVDSVGSFASKSQFTSSPNVRSINNSRMLFCSCCSHMTRAVVLTMSLIFMKRIALESIVGSTSVITKNRYEWSIQNVGTLHLVNGILVIPVSALSGWLSTMYEDRVLAIAFLTITLAGMLVMVDYADLTLFFSNENNNGDDDNVGYAKDNPWAVGATKYIIGSLIAFSGIEACESYVASMMSKVVPSALAKGTFNSGLLATLVGTGGRATGDLFITLMGLISIRYLLNLLIVPGLSLVILSIVLIRANYGILGV